MDDSSTSRTSQIGFWRTFAFLVLAPITAFVFVFYSIAQLLEGSGFGKGWKRIIGYPYIILFAVLNILHNYIVCSILFWEWPRETMTTRRLKRHKRSDDPSKREMADLLGGFLDSQDEGHY